MFGAFLVSRGVASKSQIVQALDVQSRAQRHIGDLAMDENKMSSTQVFEVLTEQKEKPGQRFGVIAVRMGFIKPNDVQDLLQKQRSCRRPIGEILVEMGVMTQDHLQRELKVYQEDNGGALQTG